MVDITTEEIEGILNLGYKEICLQDTLVYLTAHYCSEKCTYNVDSTCMMCHLLDKIN